MKLYNADCFDIFPTLKTKSIDMILCDLPYGTTKNRWDMVLDIDSLWSAYTRLIKDNGAIVLFGDGLFTATLMLSNKEMWRYNLVWDKRVGCDFLNANFKPMKSHEDIMVFYKKKPVYNKQYWYSTPYKTLTNGRASDNYGKRDFIGSESADGRRNPLTIISFARDSNRIHPTQKPVALLEYLIKTYTNGGDTVLDNCMGVGSTGVACARTGRNFIGIEKDSDFFSKATERILNEANDTEH